MNLIRKRRDKNIPWFSSMSCIESVSDSGGTFRSLVIELRICRSSNLKSHPFSFQATSTHSAAPRSSAFFGHSKKTQDENTQNSRKKLKLKLKTQIFGFFFLERIVLSLKTSF